MSPSQAVTQAIYGLHFSQFQWSHFCTFTSNTRSDDRLLAAFAQTIRRLERAAQGPIPFVRVRERGNANGHPHLHVLLAGTGHLTTEQVARKWRLGNVNVKEYDPEQGAAFYIAKSFTSDDELWDVSRGRPPLKDAGKSRRPCTVPDTSDSIWGTEGYPPLPL